MIFFIQEGYSKFLPAAAYLYPGRRETGNNSAMNVRVPDPQSTVYLKPKSIQVQARLK